MTRDHDELIERAKRINAAARFTRMGIVATMMAIEREIARRKPEPVYGRNVIPFKRRECRS
jgi:hypothetical protein